MSPLSGIASRSCLELFNGRKDRISLPTLADSIGLLANQHEMGRDYVPPLSPTTISELPVLKLILATQVILRKRLRVGLELLGFDTVPCDAIKNVW